ncbi:MAG: hypothetical protein KA118_18160, partial [Verrucomicrobia bacterium]|nr:hypothetical protein [Verrucomicrobiota bacterium]
MARDEWLAAGGRGRKAARLRFDRFGGGGICENFAFLRLFLIFFSLHHACPTVEELIFSNHLRELVL